MSVLACGEFLLVVDNGSFTENSTFLPTDGSERDYLAKSSLHMLPQTG
jgi:hypothetical protein